MNIRVWPKACHFSNATNSNEKPPLGQLQASCVQSQIAQAKLIPHKDFLHFDIQTSLLKQKLEKEFDEFNRLLVNGANTRKNIQLKAE